MYLKHADANIQYKFFNEKPRTYLTHAAVNIQLGIFRMLTNKPPSENEWDQIRNEANKQLKEY